MVMIAVGTKMPSWVHEGYQEYAKRMPAECRLELVEIAAFQRAKSVDTARAVQDEGSRMLKAIPKAAWVVALEVGGVMHSTASLSQALTRRMESGRDLVILIGGADGLDSSCLARADEQWSLSRLTFPHPLVRVVMAEQLYRAYSYANNHPYHRA